MSPTSRSSPSERALSRLLRHTRANVHPRQGITARLIAGFARQLCPNHFRGLFDIGRLPVRRLAASRRFTVIINLGIHFVVVHATPDTVVYVDPLGDPCQAARARGLVVRCARPRALWNAKPIQSRQSVACGLYALLFARCFDTPVDEWPFDASSELPLRFSRVRSRSGGRRNDARCVRYLKRFIRAAGETDGSSAAAA